jgi:colanic acid/amylovoran biosynthesis glycosyltransferase
VRLVYLIAYSGFSGSEAFFLPEVREILRQGHDLLIVPKSASSKATNRDSTEVDGFVLRKPLLSMEIAAVAVKEIARRPGSALEALRVLISITNIKASLKNLVVFPKGLWLAHVAREWGADHIHAHWATTTSSLALVCSIMSGIPWSFTTHRGDILKKNCLGAKARYARFVRFISNDTLRLGRQYFGGELEAKGVVIHLGVDIPTEDPERSSERENLVLICPGRLSPEKGHKYLIEALEMLHGRGIRPRLLVAGDGRLRKHLVQMTSAMRLEEQVSFLGHVSHDKLIELYRKHKVDLVVLPSLVEGIPVAFMEAMAFGIPVLGTAVGGVSELLGEDAGLIVEPQDPLALASGIELLLGNGDLRLRLGSAGRKRVLDQFNVRGIAADLVRNCQPQP